MPYQIGAVAELSRVSIRTLRHYDAIGLLCPTLRSDAGYRLYTDADLERLRQILFFKTLGFSLKAIAEALSDPDFDFQQAMIDQRKRLLQQQTQVEQVLNLIDTLLNEQQTRQPMSKATPSFTAFKDFDPAIYEEEAQQRWGESEAYRESQRRTQQYTTEDWKMIKSENDRILETLAQLLLAGNPADSKETLAAVEAYRLHIDRWYYPCPKTMHAQLGQMYVGDSRFKDNFDKITPGLAQYIADATKANNAN